MQYKMWAWEYQCKKKKAIFGWYNPRPFVDLPLYGCPMARCCLRGILCLEAVCGIGLC